jgi:hypothetical protein
VGIEFDRHAGRHREGLMHCAAMRDLQQAFLLVCVDSMGKMDSDLDTTDTARNFGHRPFRLDRQAVSGDAVPHTELSDEVRDTTRDGPDKEFHRTHSGILPSVLHRLVGDDSMLAAHNVVSCPAVKGGREFHQNAILEIRKTRSCAHHPLIACIDPAFQVSSYAETSKPET